MYILKTLPNGLRVATEAMPQMESVALGIWIRSGGRYEDASDSGISHLLEHLLFKGTAKRDMSSLKHEIEGRGGSFNGFTSEEHTCYLVKLLARDAQLGVDILSDMVLNPRLAAAEVEKEKAVIIEEINMYKDIPSHHVQEILAEMMWPAQPLGMPLAGTVETVKSLGREAVAAYKEKYYNPRNMLLVGTGRVSEDALIGLAEKFFSEARPGKEPRFEKARPGRSGPTVKIHSKKTEQTHIAIGIHSMDRFHPDRYALSILNIILGGNMSSRLFHIVRDELALCYEISSGVRRYEDCGALVISVGVDHGKILKCLGTIARELGRIRREPVAEDELRRAKEYYRGQLLFALEDTMSRMLWLGERLVSGEKDFDAGKILETVERVTAGDVMRAASGIMKDEAMNLAVIGPIEGEDAVRKEFHIR